jgi:superfamily II DNA helicase RecQ
MNRQKADKGSKKPSGTTKEPGRGDAQIPSACERFELAAAQVVIESARLLAGMQHGSVASRRLVNFLRGSEPPPVQVPAAGANGRAERDPASAARLGAAHGIFWAVNAAWLYELIERLVEDGYLIEAPPPSRGLTAAAGAEELYRRAGAPRNLLPRRPLLGAHPEVEERLRALRRRLAKEEGRPVYGIFNNATLAHLAHSQPSGLGELAAIPGMGENRVRRFGRRILAALKR